MLKDRFNFTHIPLSYKSFVILTLIPICIFTNESHSRKMDNFVQYSDRAGLVEVIANESTNPFLLNGKSLETLQDHKENYGVAINKFYSVQDCLSENTKEMTNPDLTNIDWNKIDTKEEAEVCLFRIASSYKSPEAMLEWFKLNHFSKVNFYNKDYSKHIAVTALWPVKERGVIFSSNYFKKIWLNRIVHGQSFVVKYNKNKNLFGTGVSNTIK